MARREGADGGTVLLAFLVGAVAGAAAALFYAPATGRETREFLGDRARESRDRVNTLAEKGRHAITEGRDTLTTAIERGREAYQQARTKENL